jgi:hypothetical protein
VHADQHAIAFDPRYNGAGNQIVYVGGDGGVFATENARGSDARGERRASPLRPACVAGPQPRL